jgi:tetratricopeptide (TPR) repeat protein
MATLGTSSYAAGLVEVKVAEAIPEDYLERIRHEFPGIRPYRERDRDWCDRGMRLLEEGSLTEAERQFKKLILSQPDHHDGLEGLALTYTRMGRKDEALFFIQEALTRARRFLADDSLDLEVLERIEQEYQQILRAKSASL